MTPLLSSRPAIAILALLTGALLPFGFAPYGFWPASLISTLVLAVFLVRPQSTMSILFTSFFFGLGLFGHGASWVYISIHDFGFTGATLAAVMTLAFVSFLAFVFCLPFFIYAKLRSSLAKDLLFLFPAVWVFGEWIRSWLFTGFPWLYVGYAHIDSPLAGWASIGGVFWLSYISVFSGCALVYVVTTLKQGATSEIKQLKPNRAQLITTTVALVSAWLVPLITIHIKWTDTTATPQSVSIIQPNVELIRKWNPYFFPDIISELDEAANAHWESDIQLWPEAAIPSVYHDVQSFIDDIHTQAQATNTNVISGVLYDNQEPYEVYNSVLGIGKASGLYFKQKLVPFGEYVPFEDQLRGLISFFDLPNSVIRTGPFRPKAISAQTNSGKNYIVAPFICYEVVYPNFVAEQARPAELLITISNDAWFGNSIGPFQHFEMVRMRALEAQKYFIRATNTGISSIIDHQGKVLAIGDQFTREVVQGRVELRQGLTPFARFGSYPVLLICMMSFIYLFFSSRRTQLR